MIKNFKASLVAFQQGQIDIWKTANPTSDMQFEDLDTHAVIAELPTTDLLTVSDFSCGRSGGFHTVEAAFGVMTLNDPGLFRHNALMDQLYRRLQPEEQITLYDAATSAVLGWMVVLDGVLATKIGRADTRTLQAILVSLKVNPLGAV